MLGDILVPDAFIGYKNPCQHSVYTIYIELFIWINIYKKFLKTFWL